ncbi:MAG TPA: hypothetical protein VEG30_18525 [Terriglobales bacterium]|nr:hypothetical protein [Terriglobales bacterium]
MRIIMYFAALLLILAAFTGALLCEQPAQVSATKDAIELPMSTSDQALEPFMGGGGGVSLPPKPAIEHGWLYDSGNVCYTMHSLIVAREGRDSDSIRLVGSRTCTWSSRFQVKRTTKAKDERGERRAVTQE